MEETINTYNIGNPDEGSPDQKHMPTAPEVKSDNEEVTTIHSVTFMAGNGLKDQKCDKKGLSPVCCDGC